MNQMIPENDELAAEARTTSDCQRQLELAVHPSALIQAALLENPNLCDVVRGEIEKTSKALTEQLNQRLT